MAISIYNSFGNMCVIASMRARRLATLALSSQFGVLFNLSIHVHATNLAILTYYHLMHSTSTVRGTSVVCYNLSTTQGSRLDMVARACFFGRKEHIRAPPNVVCTIVQQHLSSERHLLSLFLIPHTPKASHSPCLLIILHHRK
jgi:hypothetical protein